MKQYTSLWLVCLLAVFSMTARGAGRDRDEGPSRLPRSSFHVDFRGPAEGSRLLIDLGGR